MRNHTAVMCALLAICVVLFAACRDQGTGGGPAASPTLTPTPRSTPLPAVPTPIPPGDEGNSIAMVVRPAGPRADAESAAADFEAAVLARSGVVIEVRLAERYAEALAALCASGAGGQLSVAWLNAPTYVAARAQNCGVPSLQVERGTRREARTGEPGLIITGPGSNIRDVRGLAGRRLCRLGNDDFYSWLVPSLVMRANGLDPLSGPASVQDVEDLPALLQAVAANDCDAAGVPESALTEFAGALGDSIEDLAVLDTTVELPYGVLMVPLEVPLGKRRALVDALMAMAEDSTDAATMRALLSQTALLPVTPDSFAPLMEFMNATGLDFAQLGR